MQDRIFASTSEAPKGDRLSECCLYHPAHLEEAMRDLEEALTPEVFGRENGRITSLALACEEKGFVNGFAMGMALSGELAEIRRG